MEMYQSGRNEAHSKCVCRQLDTGVRIPPSPPNISQVKTEKQREKDYGKFWL